MHNLKTRTTVTCHNIVENHKYISKRTCLMRYALVLVNNFDPKILYMVYKFLMNLDKDTKRWFHPPIIYPPYKNLKSLINYLRLFISLIIPRYILLKIFPRLLYFTVIVSSNYTVHGFAYLSIKKKLIKCYESEIGIVIDKNIRGRGIGSELLKILIDEANRIPIKKITLTVLKDNITAINLYKKCGFKVVKGIKVFFNGDYLNAFKMDLYIENA